ncbi:MAG: methanogenesis marker 6 protein [Candidatus Methanosuratincola petrocarbonis]|nr:methanogenesis marker 6 protein [Candidatus Methanosuratincola sp.]
MIKTFLVVLSPDSNLTPSMLAERASQMGGIDYKETCYGLLVEGEEEKVRAALEDMRALDPKKVFYKQRGYRIGDERICRAKRGGGPRPGYHMLSSEREVLKNVSKALEGEAEEKIPPERPKAKLDVERLRRVIEEEGGED